MAATNVATNSLTKIQPLGLSISLWPASQCRKSGVFGGSSDHTSSASAHSPSSAHHTSSDSPSSFSASPSSSSPFPASSYLKVSRLVREGLKVFGLVKRDLKVFGLVKGGLKVFGLVKRGLKVSGLVKKGLDICCWPMVENRSAAKGSARYSWCHPTSLDSQLQKRDICMLECTCNLISFDSRIKKKKTPRVCQVSTTNHKSSFSKKKENCQTVRETQLNRSAPRLQFPQSSSSSFTVFTEAAVSPGPN